MTKPTFASFIKQITDADTKQVVCQFQIANVLTAIRDHKLYREAGYNNFAMMVRGELDFAPSTASRYIRLYEQYVNLKYKEDEFKLRMQQFGWSRLEKLLSGATKKMGYRALKNAEDVYNNTARGRQFHFELDDKMAATFEQYLTQHGMTTSKGGGRTNVTTSLQSLVSDYDRLKKSEFKSGKQSVRKAS